MFRRSQISVFILSLLMSLFAFAAPQTLTGTVTDTMCGKKHMIQGKTDAECTRECTKSKGDWTYGLIVGDKVYRLAGNAKQLDEAAGKQVKITGEVTGNKIVVKSITPLQRNGR